MDGVNLDIPTTQIVGIVGESGSGKSTLARAIVGLLPSNAKVVEGSIELKSRDLTKLTERELRSIRGREISMVFQDPMSYLNPVLRIGDQIAEAIPSRTNRTKEEIAEIVDNLLERVGITKSRQVTRAYPHQLSGGMRQRVLIAMAIASEPSLLIADEPTTALDVTVQAQILELIKELAEKMRSSVLLISHDLGVVAEICDTVYVMYAGKMAEVADADELFSAPMHPYTSALMNSALSIEKFKADIVGIPGEVANLADPPPGCRFHPRCPYVMDICRNREPNATHHSPRHDVYCWRYEEAEASRN